MNSGVCDAKSRNTQKNHAGNCMEKLPQAAMNGDKNVDSQSKSKGKLMYPFKIRLKTLEDWVSVKNDWKTSSKLQFASTESRYMFINALKWNSKLHWIKCFRNEYRDTWILDSGATNHTTHSSNQFKTYTPCPSNWKIVVADGTTTLGGRSRRCLDQS